MKLTKYLTLLTTAILSFSVCFGQQSSPDSTGLPGDNFSLQGALEIFKKSSSPEEFEKLINTRDNAVNNLDLDDNGEIDYVKVIDKYENDAHAFILQVAVSESENQDIAVIELEKTGDANAKIQIVGDQDIYGEETIVAPASGDGETIIENKSLSYTQAVYTENLFENNRVVVNVWLWPAVRFVYRPGYVVWNSPWRWHHHPAWWSPWKPYPWGVYRPMRVHFYRGPFVVVHGTRFVQPYRIYAPMRVSSVKVKARYLPATSRYRVTRSRTVVTGPKGNRSVRTTTVRGHGNGVHRHR